MRIYTRIVLDMTQDDMPVIESESYEYDGPMALCGRDSDASGGSANGGNGEGNENEGRNGDSERGGGFNADGRMGTTMGNRTASRGGYAAEDGLGGLAEAAARNSASNRSWGLPEVVGGVLGMAAPVPGGAIAGAKLGGAVYDGYNISKARGVDRAAVAAGRAARGMSNDSTDTTERGWNNSDGEGFNEGSNAPERGRSSDNYENLPQGLVDYLNQNLAPKDDSYKSIADIINAARDKAGLNNTAETTPVETAPVDYSSILNKYSGPSTAKPVQNNPSVKPGLGVQPVSNVAGFDASLPAYQKAPAAKAINGGDMNGGTSLISGRRTLA